MARRKARFEEIARRRKAIEILLAVGWRRHTGIFPDDFYMIDTEGQKRTWDEACASAELPKP